MPPTKGMTTADLPADKKPADGDGGSASKKPVPSQAGVDAVREDAVGTEDEPDETASEKPTKGKNRPAKAASPQPSQADADAIKEGKFRRGRNLQAEDSGVEYKTR